MRNTPSTMLVAKPATMTGVLQRARVRDNRIGRSMSRNESAANPVAIAPEITNRATGLKSRSCSMITTTGQCHR